MIKIHCVSLFGFFLLAILLLNISPSLAEDSGFYLEEWEISKGSPDVINIQDFPAELLPEGLDSLDLLVVGEPMDGPELALIGYGEDTLYLGSTSFSMYMNPVKTYSWFDEEEGLVVVASQYPYSMSTNIVFYSWNPETLILDPFDSVNEDYSVDQLLLVDSLLETGEIGLAAETLDNVMYPVRYYNNEEMSCRFLIAAHAASMVAFQEGNIQDAVQYYEAARSVFERTSCDMNWCYKFESVEHFQESPFSEFISMEELSSILGDYAIIFKNEDQIKARAFSWCAAVLGG
ncbi:MAG: hypothetical protein K8R76_07060 [Candidatus Aegiribacteria sp.]|nr:hypothetical protein [Candidatus Aegiribacteria sp.]